MPSPPDQEQILVFLEQFPSLAGVPNVALARLAGRLRPRLYKRGMLLYDDRHPLEERHLRFVYSGSVALFRIWRLQQSYRSMKWPFSWFGVEGLWRWAGHPEPPIIADESPMQGYSARAYDSSWLLDLAPGYFTQVFHGPGGPELLTALTAGLLHDSAVPLIGRGFRTGVLASTRLDHVEQMLRAGTWHTLAPGDPVPGNFGTRKKHTSALFVAKGALRSSGSGSGLHHGVVGLEELLQGSSYGTGLVAAAPTELIELPKGPLEHLLRTNAPLCRNLTNALDGDAPLGVQVNEPQIVVFFDGTRRTLPPDEAAAIVSSAAYGLNAVTSQNVTAITLTDGIQAPPGSGGTHVHFAHSTTSGLAAAILSAQSTHGGWIIVDMSGLGAPTQAALSNVETVLESNVERWTVAWLMSDPASSTEIPLRLPPKLVRRMLYTALLDPEAPTTGWAPVSAKIRRATRDGPVTLAKTAAKAIARLGLKRTEVRGEQWATGKVLTQDGWSPDGEPEEVWPTGTVRLRIPPGQRALMVQGTVEPTVIEPQMQRLGRAMNQTRVGIAVGGAGALSYVGVSMLESLISSGVPVDGMSGTSFGSAVGACYTGVGKDGLTALVRDWWTVELALAPAIISTFPLQLWVDWMVGIIPLTQTEIPFFPVATNAATMHEWDMKGGMLGNAVRASGSMPPCAPTYRGQNRLLDGGTSADVPAQVLADNGIDIVVAINPWNYPPPLPGPAIWIPFWSACWESLQPSKRWIDSYRAYMNLWRCSAYSQADWADVVYSATTSDASSMTFWKSRRIVHQAFKSEALQTAVAQVRYLWGESHRQPGDADSTSTDLEVMTVGVGTDTEPVLNASVSRSLARCAKALNAQSADAFLLTVSLGGMSTAAAATAGEAVGRRLALLLQRVGVQAKLLPQGAYDSALHTGIATVSFTPGSSTP